MDTYNSSKSNKNKIILIALAAIVLMGIGVFVYFKLSGNSGGSSMVDLNSVFDPNKPIVINKNDKYGYITSEGEILIEPQYSNAYDFNGEYAAVRIENTDVNDYSLKEYQIIDRKGTVRLEAYSYPEYYTEYNTWLIDGILYDSNLNKTLKEEIEVEYIDYEYLIYSDGEKNEVGIITFNGEKIFTTKGTYGFADISHNEYTKEDLYAVVTIYEETEDDEIGKEHIISLKTGDILFTSEDAERYYISEEDNGIFSYSDDEDEENIKYLFFINNKLAYQTTEEVDELVVYDYRNQILEIDYGYRYEELGKNQRWYYYDVKNKKMLEESPEYPTSIEDLEEELEEKVIEDTLSIEKYTESGKYGIKSGEEVLVPCEYESIEYLDINLVNYLKSKGKELVLLEKDRELVLYDLKNKKTIMTFKSSYIYSYDDSTFIKANIYEDNSYYVYNILSGKSMTFERDNFTIRSNYIEVKKEGKIIYYNTDFKEIYVTEEF